MYTECSSPQHILQGTSCFSLKNVALIALNNSQVQYPKPFIQFLCIDLKLVFIGKHFDSITHKQEQRRDITNLQISQFLILTNNQAESD